jgi:hypothetical protein
MIARMGSPRVESRLGPAAVLLCVPAIAFVVVRLIESPGNPATAFRILMSALAIGFVLFARHKSMMQRATVFVALEALGGFFAFAYVDVPFVVSHQSQIGALAISLYDGMHGEH